MRSIAIVLLLIASFPLSSFSQEAFKFIFVPHVRSEDATNQTVNPGIAKIDFTKYSLKMLGGDLAPQTSKTEKTMKYLDSLFDLKDSNTLWTLGNHDLEQGDSNRIKQYTGRPLFYPYARDGITFMVLNTELAANGFTATYIKSPQLDTLKAVCERVTSADTKFFVVLHSRYMWMIGNPYFTKAYIDSIAASSKSMTQTNWYTDVEPLLKQVKDKGIQVIVFGGDKSQINVSYPDTTKSFNASAIQDIHYFAARMENTFTEDVNNVIVIDYIKNTSFTCRYVTLTDINKETPVVVSASPAIRNHLADRRAAVIRQTPGSRTLTVRLSPGNDSHGVLRIYAMNGTLYRSITLTAGKTEPVRIEKAGMYIIRTESGTVVHEGRFIVY